MDSFLWGLREDLCNAGDPGSSLLAKILEKEMVTFLYSPGEFYDEPWKHCAN